LIDKSNELKLNSNKKLTMTQNTNHFKYCYLALTLDLSLTLPINRKYFSLFTSSPPRLSLGREALEINMLEMYSRIAFQVAGVVIPFCLEK